VGKWEEGRRGCPNKRAAVEVGGEGEGMREGEKAMPS